METGCTPTMVGTPVEGIVDDTTCQMWWQELIAMTARKYGTPGGKVRRIFVRDIRDELQGVHTCRWNADNFIVFKPVILRHAHNVTIDPEIRQRIGKRLDAWEKGQNQILVKDTAYTCKQYNPTENFKAMIASMMNQIKI